MIYLDNAATSSPKPEGIIKATITALREFSANPGRSGHDMSIKVSERVFECRKKCASFFGAEDETGVVFTQNCTASLNFVIKGILKKGDHVICSSLEHNAVIRPLWSMTKRGVEFDIAEVIFDDEEAIVRTVEKLIKPNTKLIIFTHASNVTGQVMPIKLIGEVCKKRGISLAVDAAQTAGILPINMEEMNIDYLAVAPHKGLYAPMGTGILIARKNIPETLIEGGTGTMSFSREQPEELPERLESGTVNVAGILGISAGIDFVNGKTIKRIHEYEIGLMTRLYEGLKKIAGVTVYSANPRLGKTTAVLSFNLRNVPSSTLAEILNKKGIAVRAGLHCAPEAHKRLGTADSGTVRVAPSVFTRKEDIDYLISVIKSI